LRRKHTGVHHLLAAQKMDRAAAEYMEFSIEIETNYLQQWSDGYAAHTIFNRN
jgi:hypothetical protein